MAFRKLIAQWRAAWRRYHSLGQRGERFAERYVRRQGYQIVGRRQRSRLGELDLVAVDGRTVVFIEVKTRRSHDAGSPSEAVGAEKQRRLTRLALAWLKRHELLEHRARFDVMSLTWPTGERRPHVEYLVDAFQAIGVGQMHS